MRDLLQAKRSNMRHRPIGIGVQGLADAFILMRYPFESEEARLLNKQIFETIYFGALEASCKLAEQHGPYETYEGSPVSKGVCGVQRVAEMRGSLVDLISWQRLTSVVVGSLT